MNSWKAKFQNEVTSTAFHLTLSRRMILALRLVKQYEEVKHLRKIDDMIEYNHFVPSVHCLIARGLVEHHDIEVPKGLLPFEIQKFHDEHTFYNFTDAGKLVYQLCELAGLIPVRLDASNEEAA